MALATIALVAALVAASPAPALASYEGMFGVNVQGLADLPRGQVERHLDVIAAGGVELVRRDASWDVAEPEPPVGGRRDYRWERFDRELAGYARHGLRWLPIVDYSTPWAASVPGDPFSPPARTDDYAAYAAALASRYGTNGSFWSEHPELPRLPVTRYEIWNEPNAELFWHPSAGAPERYAELYQAAQQAIRAADPAARVIVGGLALANTKVTDQHAFMRAMVAHRPQLAQTIDAVALHPYAPTPAAVLDQIAEFRDTLTGLGLGHVPLEITEIGWTTTNTPEQTRATNLQTLAGQLPRSDCNIQSLIPHTWTTPEQDPADPEHWFGIANHDTTPKPTATAYMTAVQAMRNGPAEAGSLPVCAAEPPNPSGVRRLPARAEAAAAADARHAPRGPPPARAGHASLPRWLQARADPRPPRPPGPQHTPGGPPHPAVQRQGEEGHVPAPKRGRAAAPAREGHRPAGRGHGPRPNAPLAPELTATRAAAAILTLDGEVRPLPARRRDGRDGGRGGDRLLRHERGRRPAPRRPAPKRPAPTGVLRCECAGVGGFAAWAG